MPISKPVSLQHLANKRPLAIFSDAVSIFFVAVPAGLGSVQYTEHGVTSHLNPSGIERKVLDTLDFVVPTVELAATATLEELEGYSLAGRMSFSFTCDNYAYFGVASFGPEYGANLSEQLGWRCGLTPEAMRSTLVPGASKKTLSVAFNMTTKEPSLADLINISRNNATRFNCGMYRIQGHHPFKFWVVLRDNQHLIEGWLQRTFGVNVATEHGLEDDNKLTDAASATLVFISKYVATDTLPQGIFFLRTECAIIAAALGETAITDLKTISNLFDQLCEPHLKKS